VGSGWYSGVVRQGKRPAHGGGVLRCPPQFEKKRKMGPSSPGRLFGSRRGCLARRALVQEKAENGPELARKPVRLAAGASCAARPSLRQKRKMGPSSPGRLFGSRRGCLARRALVQIKTENGPELARKPVRLAAGASCAARPSLRQKREMGPSSPGRLFGLRRGYLAHFAG